MMEPAPAPAPAPTPAPAPAPAPSSQLVEAQPLREDGLEFLSDTLEREYGDLFIETEEQDDTESVTTLDTAATVNLRKVSNNELYTSPEIGRAGRNELGSADAKSLARNRSSQGPNPGRACRAGWQKHVELEYEAGTCGTATNKLGRGALSVDHQASKCERGCSRQRT